MNAWFFFLTESYDFLFIFQFIRVNQVIFSGSSNIDSYASGNEVRNAQLPSVSSKERSEEQESIDDSGNQYQIKTSFSSESFGHQMPNLVTLSLLPRSQWQSLTNLDIIKVGRLMHYLLTWNKNLSIFLDLFLILSTFVLSYYILLEMSLYYLKLSLLF